mmetsp:Transcript_35229/g.103406  ORF Transcript_35229/g.103406 Transcript_35229/m.103406 type:complete len:226 (+) Transcript_35229:765-1442(+)
MLAAKPAPRDAAPRQLQGTAPASGQEACPLHAVAATSMSSIATAPPAAQNTPPGGPAARWSGQPVSPPTGGAGRRARGSGAVGHGSTWTSDAERRPSSDAQRARTEPPFAPGSRATLRTPASPPGERETRGAPNSASVLYACSAPAASPATKIGPQAAHAVSSIRCWCAARRRPVVAPQRRTSPPACVLTPHSPDRQTAVMLGRGSSFGRPAAACRHSSSESSLR